MGVKRCSKEEEISVPPSRMFQAFCVDSYNLFPKLFPESIKSVRFLEGDRMAVGCVKQATFAEEKGIMIHAIRSIHDKEFENETFMDFYDQNDITDNFLAPRIVQQNDVVERNNRTMEEVARTLLGDSKLPK